MPFRVVRVQRLIAAPVAAVFDRIADHEGYARLPGVRRARLLRPGQAERNGTGAQRELVIGIGRLVEQIGEFRPPHYLAYRIIAAPLPIEHRGSEVRLREVAGGTEVTWVTRFRARSRLGAGPVEQLAAVSFTAAFGTALFIWKRALEASHPRHHDALPESAAAGAPAAAAPPAQRAPGRARRLPRVRPFQRTRAALARLVRGGLGLPGRLLRGRR